MNGMELNVNYSILFFYTCGLAYYSLSSSLSLPHPVSLSLSTSMGYYGKTERKRKIGEREENGIQLELWIFVLFIYLFSGVNVVNAFAGWC